MSEQKAPYKSLGSRLKYVREQSNQTLAEVSGAVEIDEELLERIEAGEERPPEDILMLLINYFEVQEREALQLWELAEYGREAPEQFSKQTVMLLAMDLRTLYSDTIEINANKSGLTFTFSQAGPNGQATPVSRIGMSREQGQAVFMALQKALLEARYLESQRLLPPPDASSDKV